MFSEMKKTRMLSLTPGERTHKRVIQIFAFFLAVWGICSLGRSVVSIIGALLVPSADASIDMLIQLFGTTVASLAVILWVRLFERRSYLSLGFVKEGAVSEYLIGIVGGVLLFGAAVGVCVLCGVAEIRVTAEQPAWWFLALFFVGFLIQGMSEELLCRSFLMVTLSRKWPLWACALTNAAVFSALHLLNPGIAPIALLNIFLFGVLASLLTLRRGSIWMVSAVHSLWNFAQGNLFGIPVSGLTGMPSPLSTTMDNTTWWGRLIGGGAFGVEGGLGATVVQIVGILILLAVPTRKREIMDK